MKTVAYSSPFVPVEWIAAHRLRPSRMRLRPADLGRRVGVMREVCPYAEAFLGAVLSLPSAGDGACPADGRSACAVVVTTTCDQMRHAAALMARDADHPVFLLNVPSTWQTAAAVGLYRDELKRLGRFLVQLGGSVPSPEDLAKVMLEYESARTALLAVRETMSARQFAEAIAGLSRKGIAARDGDGAVAGLRTEPLGVAAGSSDAGRTGAVPLALLGGPLLESDYAMLDRIEQAGGRVVLDATEGGERTLPGTFDRRAIREDPLRALCRAYFGTIPDAFRRPNNRLYEWLGRELSARQVRGVLLRRYVWCDLWHAELHRLREWSPVPVLDIDTCHDEEGSPARTAGRIEAFLEMLR